MPSSSFPLLDLPRELRDAIYEQYVIVEGGYTYDFETGKLRAANDPEHSIDLALMYTCSQVANEMKGLALGVNTITFRTLSSPELDFRAIQLDHIIGAADNVARRLLGHTHYSRETDDLDILVRAFPECQPLLRLARLVEQGSPPLYNQSCMDIEFLTDGSWREVPSVSREVFRYALEVASKLGYSFDDLRPTWFPMQARDALEIQSTYMPWAIPTQDEINYVIRKTSKNSYDSKCWTYIGTMIPFSAAAVAIKFLHDTPIATRKYIRKIVIHEDRSSVASPECHAKGLIPFCVENPFLCIERRLDLWRTMLCDQKSVRYELGRAHYGRIGGNVCSDSVAPWLVEAMDLSRAGMPEKSFSLIIDGNPAPAKSFAVFQRLQRDAAWQEAFDEACVRNLLPTPCLWEKRGGMFYIRKDFPKVLGAVTNIKSFFIRCNFDLGSWDIEPIIDQNRNYSLSEWDENSQIFPVEGGDSEDNVIDTPPPPFQSWRDLVITEYIHPGKR